MYGYAISIAYDVSLHLEAYYNNTMKTYITLHTKKKNRYEVSSDLYLAHLLGTSF